MKTRNKRKYGDYKIESIFAKRLETAMIDFGVGIEELDLDDICASSMLRRYLKGECMPTLRTAWRIADYLGVTVDWLCGMDSDSNEDDIYDKKQEEFFENFDSEAPWGTLE